MARSVLLIAGLLAGCTGTLPGTNAVVSAAAERAQAVNLDRVIKNKSLTLSIDTGSYHCQSPGAGLGYPKCTEIPIVVLEVPVTAKNPGGCIVLVPYQTLFAHYKKQTHPRVTWNLFAGDKYFFADSYQGTAVDGVTLHSPGNVWKKKSHGRVKSFSWDAESDLKQPSDHTVYVGWLDGNILKDCDPLDPIIINEAS